MIKRKSLPGPGSNKYDSELESFAIMFTQKQHFINTRTSDFSHRIGNMQLIIQN